VEKRRREFGTVDLARNALAEWGGPGGAAWPVRSANDWPAMVGRQPDALRGYRGAVVAPRAA